MHLVSNKASQNVLMATYFAMTDQRLHVYHSCGKTHVSEKYWVWGFFENMFGSASDFYILRYEIKLYILR